MRFKRGLEGKATFIDHGTQLTLIHHASHFAQDPSVMTATLAGKQRQQNKNA
jgi:hypothetical protein